MAPHEDAFQKDRNLLAYLILAGTAFAIVLAFLVT